MKKNNIKNICDLIAETPPYLQNFQTIKHYKNGTLKVELLFDQNYYNNNFGKLIQVASSIGSYCIALKHYNQSQNIYLGKKMRIRKHNFLQLSNDKIFIIATPIINGKKNVKAIINLFSKDQLSYSFELDYTIFTRQAFEKIFRNQKSILIEDKEVNNCLPNIDIININNYNFKIKISPFDINHCLGHFKDYPIVPSVLVLDCLISGI